MGFGSIRATPCLNVSNGGDDVTGSVNLRFQHNDNDIHVRVADSCFRDGNGFNSNGLSFGIRRAGGLEAVYDAGNNDPWVRFNDNLNIRDKNVGLRYTHHIKSGDANVRATVGVDDNNDARITYNLSGFDAPDHRNLTLGWVHRHDDLTVEPSYNLGTESLSAAVTYRVDDENSLKAHFDMNTNNGSLTWTNSGALGGGGNLRVTATAAMDGGAVKQVPTLRIEKDWDIDA